MTPAANSIRKPTALTAASSRVRPLQSMPVRRAGRSQASVFAIALYARHAQATGLSPPLDLVHRHLPALRWSGAIHQHWQLGLAPQLRLQFAGDTWLASLPPSAVMPKPDATSPPTLFVPAGTTLERLLLRSQRIDCLRTLERTVHAAPLQASTEAPLRSPVPARMRAELRVERVYRDREVAARQLASGAAATIPDTRAVGATAVSRLENSTPAANTHAPDVDIQRLADRVVNAIDRRLLAHRERLGRT